MVRTSTETSSSLAVVGIVAIPGAPCYQAQAAEEHAHYIAKPLARIDTHPNDTGKLHITTAIKRGVPATYDLAVIGGGINGCGIGRRGSKQTKP